MGWYFHSTMLEWEGRGRYLGTVDEVKSAYGRHLLQSRADKLTSTSS